MLFFVSSEKFCLQRLYQDSSPLEPLLLAISLNILFCLLRNKLVILSQLVKLTLLSALIPQAQQKTKYQHSFIREKAAELEAGFCWVFSKGFSCFCKNKRKTTDLPTPCLLVVLQNHHFMNGSTIFAFIMGPG